MMLPKVKPPRHLDPIAGHNRTYRYFAKPSGLPRTLKRASHVPIIIQERRWNRQRTPPQSNDLRPPAPIAPCWQGQAWDGRSRTGKNRTNMAQRVDRTVRQLHSSINPTAPSSLERVHVLCSFLRCSTLPCSGDTPRPGCPRLHSRARFSAVVRGPHGSRHLGGCADP